jgi:hypothetical protein
MIQSCHIKSIVDFWLTEPNIVSSHACKGNDFISNAFKLNEEAFDRQRNLQKYNMLKSEWVWICRIVEIEIMVNLRTMVLLICVWRQNICHQSGKWNVSQKRTIENDMNSTYGFGIISLNQQSKLILNANLLFCMEIKLSGNLMSHIHGWSNYGFFQEIIPVCPHSASILNPFLCSYYLKCCFR